jgi:hypothetical protein
MRHIQITRIPRKRSNPMILLKSNLQDLAASRTCGAKEQHIHTPDSILPASPGRVKNKYHRKAARTACPELAEGTPTIQFSYGKPEGPGPSTEDFHLKSKNLSSSRLGGFAVEFTLQSRVPG